jgi:hypothetical protein
MGWYVSKGDKMWGPLEETAVLQGVAQGTYGAGMLVRDEGGAWQPIERSIFGAMLGQAPKPAVAAVAPPGSSRPLVAVASVTMLIILGFWAYASFRKPSPPTLDATTAAAAAAEPEPPREPTLSERVHGTDSLSGAILILAPHMGDVTDGTIHPTAALLAIWQSKHLRWNDLELMPDVRRADVMKDPDSHRGRKLCASGSIIEIHADNTVNPPVFFGGLMTSSYDMVRFVAVRSTGDLVQGSVGRFCGIVTGLESYANTGGGTTHAVFSVGMFDLPENR